MINTLKEHYPNVYILIVTLAIALFFEGVSRIVNSIVPQTVSAGIALCVGSLVILYADDQSLSELFSISDTTKEASAIISPQKKRENNQ